MEKSVNIKGLIYFYSFDELQKFSRESPNFRGEVRKSAYEKESLKRLSAKLAVDGFSKIIDCYFVRRYEDDGHYFYEYAGSCYLLHEIETGRYYRIFDQQGKGRLFSFVLHNGLNIPYRYGFSFDKKEPNRVGVATKLKLKKWFDYLLEKEDAKKRFLEVVQNTRTAFTEEVENNGLTINWKGDNNGYIQKGAFRYNFTLSNSGKVFGTLELDFSLAHPDLKEFLALPMIG